MRPDPVLKPVYINNLINSTLSVLSNTCIKHSITVQIDNTMGNDTALFLDYNQVKQVLLNVLLNAIDAMPNSGLLIVTTIIIGRNKIFQIKIQDTGSGIHHEDLPHIFDPFFSKKDNGTGLGLSISYEIMKKHGGKIYAESTLGKGSTFYLEFPVGGGV